MALSVWYSSGPSVYTTLIIEDDGMVPVVLSRIKHSSNFLQHDHVIMIQWLEPIWRVQVEGANQQSLTGVGTLSIEPSASAATCTYDSCICSDYRNETDWAMYTYMYTAVVSKTDSGRVFSCSVLAISGQQRPFKCACCRAACKVFNCVDRADQLPPYCQAACQDSQVFGTFNVVMFTTTVQLVLPPWWLLAFTSCVLFYIQ